MTEVLVETDLNRGSRPANERNRLLGWVRRGTVVAVAVAVAWFGSPTAWEWSVGLCLAAIGEAIRCWSAGYLVKSRLLITGGPYAYVRNPLYLGRLFILSGVFLAAAVPGHWNLAVLGVCLAVFFVYYMPRKERVEPARLLKNHGEPYRRYRAEVRSIWPRLRPYAARHGAWRWANFAGNEEYAMVLALVTYFALLAVRTADTWTPLA